MNLSQSTTLAILGIGAVVFGTSADSARAQCFTYSPGYSYATGIGPSYYVSESYAYVPPVVTYVEPVVPYYSAPVYVVERPHHGFGFSFSYYRPHHGYSHHYYGHHYSRHHYRRHYGHHH